MDLPGTPGSASSHIEFNAAGTNDNENLNGEWVDIRNDGDKSEPLGGWTLKDDTASHRYAFPKGLVLGPREVVRVYTGCLGDPPPVPPDTPLPLYWCGNGFTRAIWNNEGDTAYLLDTNGSIAKSCNYREGSRSETGRECVIDK